MLSEKVWFGSFGNIDILLSGKLYSEGTSATSGRQRAMFSTMGFHSFSSPCLYYAQNKSLHTLIEGVITDFNETYKDHSKREYEYELS
jgi:hypothetical protein